MRVAPPRRKSQRPTDKENTLGPAVEKPQGGGTAFANYTLVCRRCHWSAIKASALAVRELNKGLKNGSDVKCREHGAQFSSFSSFFFFWRDDSSSSIPYTCENTLTVFITDTFLMLRRASPGTLHRHEQRVIKLTRERYSSEHCKFRCHLVFILRRY